MNVENIKVFSKNILTKGYYCNEYGNDDDKNKDIKLNLYISINDVCNARCKFCNIPNSKSLGSIFDISKLEVVLKELKKSDRLNRIAITGGETFLNIDLLNQIIDCITKNIEQPFITINTNGSFLNRISDIKNIDEIDGIHISRHHYDDSKNNEIFGIKTAAMNEINEANKKYGNNLIRLNCNLIKGYIDSYDEVEKYLNIAIQNDIFRVGFVGLMKINNFCEEKYVNFKHFIFGEDIIRTRQLYDTNICECENYVYYSGETGKTIEAYFRQVKDLNCNYCRQLSYTCDNKILSGFGKKPII